MSEERTSQEGWRLLGVRGLVTALLQGVVDAEIRCNKAVTSHRTPRRRPFLLVLSPTLAPEAQRVLSNDQRENT
jgi:hypothetical protein